MLRLAPLVTLLLTLAAPQSRAQAQPAEPETPPAAGADTASSESADPTAEPAPAASQDGDASGPATEEPPSPNPGPSNSPEPAAEAPPYYTEAPPGAQVDQPISGIIEPPPPVAARPIDAPSPPVPTGRVAPRSALWLGLRGEWLIPRGSLWSDGQQITTTDDQTLCCLYTNRSFTAHAKSGPSLEANIGVRIARRYMVFSFWQHAFFRDGSRRSDVLGAQKGAHSDLVGLGLRFSTNPSDLGFVLEIGLGYRRFKASWEGREGSAASGDPRLPNAGATLVLKDEFLSSRLGLGADWRVHDRLTLSPLLLFTGGAFRDPAFQTTDGREVEPVEPPLVDRIRASYVTVTLSLGAHYDIY